MRPSNSTLLLAGAGLANALIALAVTRRDPSARIVLFDRAAAPGGNHTWSFHDQDLDTPGKSLLEPLVAHRWNAQEVRFPGFERGFDSGYASATTDRLVAELKRQENIELRCGTEVVGVEPDAVRLADGNRVNGSATIDGRGPRDRDGLILGFQKFLGQEILTRQPHGLERPVIMDATVSQADGYRFIYLLPFDDRRVLIEDTYYSDGADLASSELAERIAAYAQAQGWEIDQVLREERGVLPILLAGNFDQFWPRQDPVARSGLNAALFHPTTGYSLPQAAALAEAVAAAWPLDGAAMARLTRSHAQRLWQSTAFFRMLNRMLFRAGRPEHRYRVLQRFYSLDPSLITNFYAASLTLRERVRILSGKPPVPVLEAMTVMNEASFLRREAAVRANPEV